MYRRAILAGCFAVILFGGVLQAQNQLSIRAASTDPVKGWKRMSIGYAVWVSPTVSLTAADIQSAQASVAPDGGRAVSLVFTDAGSRKMRELSAIQINQPIALILDGKLIWAPTVHDEISKEAMITGKRPNDLTLEQVQKILASVNQK